MIVEQDDIALHYSESDADPNEHPDNAYQESIYISFADLKQGIGGVWRIGLEHNQKRANCCATLWRENGTSYGYFFRHHALPAGDWTDMEVGVLRYNLVEPLKKVRARLSDSDLSVEFDFSAHTPIFDFARDASRSLQGWTSQHYQQFGHFEARVTWGQESFTIGGIAFRDHSWGAREWERGWDWFITGGAFLPNENIIYVWKDCRDGELGDGGLVLTHMDPSVDTRVPFSLSDYEPILDPPPIVTGLSYTLHTPERKQRLWGRAVAPTLVMPYGKAHFTTAFFKWDVDGEMGYGIVDNFGGRKYAHDSRG